MNDSRFPPMPESNPEQQVRVNLAALETVVCEKCGNNTYEAVYMIKRMSPLHPLAGGEEHFIPLAPPVIPPIFACKKCQHINKAFIPAALRDDIVSPKQESSPSEPVIATSLSLLGGSEPPAGSSPDTERK